MTNPTPRQQLLTELVPLLPYGWKVVTVERNVDALTKPFVMLKQQTIRKNATAPRGALTIGWTLTIVSPHQDITKAELQLDHSVASLLFAINQVGGLTWSTATKVTYEETRLGYDIDIETNIGQKD
jgi:hypothetical protein